MAMGQTETKALMVACTVAGTLTWLSSAAASPIGLSVVNFGTDLQAAQNALAGLEGGPATTRVTETFENYASGRLVTEGGGLSTAVGTFARGGGLDGDGICNEGDADCLAPGILNAAGSPFSGRFNTSLVGGNWLDSNDVTELVWDMGGLDFSFSQVAFLLTDAGDVDGTLTIGFAGDDENIVKIDGQGDGEINLVVVDFGAAATSDSLIFRSSSRHDGFGFDDATIFAAVSSGGDDFPPGGSGDDFTPGGSGGGSGDDPGLDGGSGNDPGVDGGSDPGRPGINGPSVVMEPATLAVLGSGLALLGLLVRRRDDDS